MNQNQFIMTATKVNKTEEKATIYFGMMFLLTVILDFINDYQDFQYPLVGGVLVIAIIVCLILGLKTMSSHPTSKEC